MLTGTRRLGIRAKTIVAGALCSATLALSLGVVVPSSSAAPSAFCSTLMTYHATTPSVGTVAGYHAWAKAILPFYEKLQSTAPNTASKKTLTEIVTILKDYESSATMAKLIAYETANRAHWITDTKALAAAIISCAKSLG